MSRKNYYRYTYKKRSRRKEKLNSADSTSQIEIQRSQVRNGSRRRQSRKAFSIYPVATLSWKNPARRAIVYWGRGGQKEYRLDHLSNNELRIFWALNDVDKAAYLKKNFNQHHRLPRCQNGPTERWNLSQVDIVSHQSYNSLISVVARWSGVRIEMVKTKHIAAFLLRIYPTLEKLITHSDTKKLKSLEDVVSRKNLEGLSSFFISRVVARWACVELSAVQFSDIRHFLEHIYPPIKRLAFDHELDRLRTINSFVKILNEIWLPMHQQMYFKR